MTSFSMDEHGNIIKDPATEDDLSRWANAYHEKYFTGPAPDIHIKIVDDAGGVACFNTESKTACIDVSTTRSEKFTRIALLHEMVHINLFGTTGNPDADHGTAFITEIKRLMQARAYDQLL
jgi:hypothetical protein